MKLPLSQQKGFFAEYYLKLRAAGGATCESDIAKLSTCGNDDERVAYVDQLSWVRDGDAELQVQREFNGKSLTASAELKERATVSFKQKKWIEAMLLYSRSYVALPNDKVLERSIALANRSATLYHMQKYCECLVDIRRSLELEYPKDLVYKLYERQARCYVALKDYPRTISAFKKCITAMDDSTLPADRRSKLHLDAMTMIKMLERDPRTGKQAARQEKLAKTNFKYEEKAQALPDEKEFVSSLVRIDQNPQEGRFARAAADVQVGQELLVEHPYVAVLLEKYAHTHCEYCFVRTVVPVACPGCSDVIYCSEQCQQRSADKYHKYECGILPIIWRSGASINNHMALRIIASKPLDYFLQLRPSLDEDLSLEQLLSLPKDDFRRVAHLERHQKERAASNFFQYVLMARFLTRCLQSAGYFGTEPQPDQIRTINALLLRSLQFIQFNTHEVAELHKYSSEGREKSIFIGGAIYPTLALFNHSCDPGVVRYFRGTTIHINSVRPIEAGLPINENYGPIYTQDKREDRQARLKDLYWFECNCDACLDNWPLFDELPRDLIRFRCDAPNNCAAIIEVPPTCNDFMINCVTCGETTNILKGLKVMQDTEMMTRTAKRLYDTGEYSKALNKFVDLLRIMYEVLAPPFPDFCECQQHLKDCFLNLGNVYKLD
ncbi:SET and MYND domain-containing protein 4 [Drosophila grimshawi]|uniref:GH21386 n=1 Tax=Drosophila grimshawi TaxID=7222 RepID=B4J8Z5_DROGR|nr:SET and MYND domain-containing protein 4 [Drosophila grimshawi]XP_032590504.1 SET and MYND domain-containing protein 4 [Drosophila grimshawi]EDW01344.1 GH21386 [Drosophila grimshawi]